MRKPWFVIRYTEDSCHAKHLRAATKKDQVRDIGYANVPIDTLLLYTSFRVLVYRGKDMRHKKARHHVNESKNPKPYRNLICRLADGAPQLRGKVIHSTYRRTFTDGQEWRDIVYRLTFKAKGHNLFIMCWDLVYTNRLLYADQKKCWKLLSLQLSQSIQLLYNLFERFMIGALKSNFTSHQSHFDKCCRLLLVFLVGAGAHQWSRGHATNGSQWKSKRIEKIRRCARQHIDERIPKYMQRIFDCIGFLYI